MAKGLTYGSNETRFTNASDQFPSHEFILLNIEEDARRSSISRFKTYTSLKRSNLTSGSAHASVLAKTDKIANPRPDYILGLHFYGFQIKSKCRDTWI